jgi:hypothetical protein
VQKDRIGRRRWPTRTIDRLRFGVDREAPASSGAFPSLAASSRCPDVAPNRHGRPDRRCPVSGVERKWDFEGGRSVVDPSETKLCAADMAPLVSVSERVGLAGLTRRPATLAFGANWCSNSSRFGVTSALSCVIPVMFSPGLLRLVTSPSWIGSKPVSKTIGMVVFAAFAASAAGVLVAAITVAFFSTRSAIKAGSRSEWFMIASGLPNKIGTAVQARTP